MAGRENLLSRVDYDCMTVKLVVASGGKGGSCRKRPRDGRGGGSGRGRVA